MSCNPLRILTAARLSTRARIRPRLLAANRADTTAHAIQSCAAVMVLLERCATVQERLIRHKTAGQHGDVAQLAERLLCNSPVVCAVLSAVLPGSGDRMRHS